MRKLSCRPFRDHDWFLLVQSAHFLVGPVKQRRYVRPRFIFELLTVNAQPQPVYIVWAGIVGRGKIPDIKRIGIIISVKHPLDVFCAASPRPINYMAICSFEALRSFPLVWLVIHPFFTPVIPTRPRKPIAIHFDPESHDHRMAELVRRIRPLVDITIPHPINNCIEVELIWSPILFVGLIPGRPVNQRRCSMSPDHLEVRQGKALLAPVTWRGNDRLMFSDHLLEIFDHFQRNLVLGIAEVDERAGVNAAVGNFDFDRTVPIDRHRYPVLSLTCDAGDQQCNDQTRESFSCRQSH